MSLSDALGAHGAPVQIDHNGKRYTLKKITQKVKDAIKQRLRLHALNDAYADRAQVPPDLYMEMIDSISRLTAAGAYDYGGPVYVETMKTHEGLAWVLAVLLDCSEDEAYALMLERPDEMRLLMREVMRGSLPRAVVEAMDRAEAESGKPHPAEENPT